MNSPKPGKTAISFTPSYRQQVMLEQLAVLRRAASYTQRGADKALDWGTGTVARYELAEKRLLPDDLDSMLDLYGADRETRADLHARLAVNLEDAYWERYDWVTSAYARLMIAETAALSITSSEGTSFPGLTQTREYALDDASKIAMTREPDVWDEYWEVRQLRQAVLDKWVVPEKKKPPMRMPYTVYLAESLLTWGSPEILTSQLAHLLDIGKKSNVTIRIVPKESGVPVFSYDLMKLPDDREIATTALPSTTMILEEKAQLRVVRLHLAAYDRLALSEKESAGMIEEKLKGFK